MHLIQIAFPTVGALHKEHAHDSGSPPTPTQIGPRNCSRALNRRIPVNQIIGNFEKVLAGMNVKVPAQMTEMIQGNVDQAISAYEKAAENMKSCGEAANAMIGKQQALTREIGERVLHNTTANIEASVDVAKKLAASRSIQEAMKIQADFMQAQTKRFAEQSHDMVSLAMKSVAEAVASWSTVLPTKTKA